jgi:hypothetical protein
MDSGNFVFIGLIALLVFTLMLRQQPRERYYQLASDIGENTRLVKEVTQAMPATQTTQTGLGAAQLYTSALFQGDVKPLVRGEEVEFMVQQPGGGGKAAVRIWKYRSIKKDQFNVLKFTAHLQKTKDKDAERLVIYAEPRYGNIADIEAYLSEDPQLASSNTLAFDSNLDRAANFTVTLV